METALSVPALHSKTSSREPSRGAVHGADPDLRGFQVGELIGDLDARFAPTEGVSHPEGQQTQIVPRSVVSRGFHYNPLGAGLDNADRQAPRAGGIIALAFKILDRDVRPGGRQLPAMDAIRLKNGEPAFADPHGEPRCGDCHRRPRLRDLQAVSRRPDAKACPGRCQQAYVPFLIGPDRQREIQQQPTDRTVAVMFQGPCLNWPATTIRQLDRQSGGVPQRTWRQRHAVGDRIMRKGTIGGIYNTNYG